MNAFIYEGDNPSAVFFFFGYAVYFNKTEAIFLRGTVYFDLF